MNRAIELRGSRIEFILPQGEQTTIELNPAVLHESEGKPGIDAGAGFLQNVHLQLKTADITSFIDELPVRITHGTIVAGEKTLDNFIPLPLIHLGHTEIELKTDKGSVLKLTANSAVAILTGEKKAL
ncbi:MAG: hypothetical protein AB8C02_00240 [Halioglobus sp.]